MKRTLILATLAFLLQHCGFVHDVWGPGGTRDQWNNYLNSNAYHQTTYKSSVSLNDRTTTCYTTVDDRDGSVVSRCFQ